MSQLHFRNITKQNLPELLAIEQAATPFPWSEKAHADAIHCNYPSLLLEIENKIKGFVIFNWLADECHLLNIVIAPVSQGQGLAKALIMQMLELADSQNMSKVILEVRASNTPAMALYKKLGFEQIGLRKNYYRGNLTQESGREDAIVMKKAL